MKPALSRGELQCIGATTKMEYTKYSEVDPALNPRFQAIIVNELSIYNTVAIV
jgi:ATP-dependent Clp protease ATP-binding subunit ClpA